MSEHYTEVCAQSDEAAWKAARWEGISASMVPLLMGLNKWDKRSHDEILMDYALRKDAFVDNPSAEAGRRLERPILDWAGDVGGFKIDSWGKLCRSSKHPYLLATPDGVVRSDKDAPMLVECKTHREFGKRDWEQGPPSYVMAQVLVQMIVTGIHQGYVVQWWFGSLPKLWPVEYDARHANAIIHVASESWAEIERMRKECGV